MLKQIMNNDPIDFESINDIDLDLDFWIDEEVSTPDFNKENIRNLEVS